MQSKKTVTNSVHEFTFYYEKLSEILHQDIDIVIACDELYHRFKHVVRVQADDKVIIFNQVERVTFVFAKFEGKNKIVGTWQNRLQNQALSPSITFLLPMLKPDALHEAVYNLAEVGITTIQLLITQKTQHLRSDKLLDKLNKVAIAAAEQSKMYAYPTILPPIQLQEWLKVQGESPEFMQAKKYHFDVTGKSFASWYAPVQEDENYYLLVGPEGDLSLDEKLAVQSSGFQACLLTRTVLRSVRTVSLVSGLFRL